MRNFPIKIKIRCTDSSPLLSNKTQKIEEMFEKRRNRFSEQIFTIFLVPILEKMPTSNLNYFSTSQIDVKLARESLGQRGGSVIYNFKRLGKFKIKKILFLDFSKEVEFRLFPEVENYFEIGLKDGILKTRKGFNTNNFSYSTTGKRILIKNKDF